MISGLSIGSLTSGPRIRRVSIGSSVELLGNTIRIRMQRVPPTASDEVALGELLIDGQSVLDQVANPVSPQLAATPNPGRITGQGRIVTALSETLEVGALYLVSYEILEDGGTTGLFFPDAGGSPFPRSTSAPFTVGRHAILVEAKDTDTNALLRMTGDLTFGHVSCRKAEWTYSLPPSTSYDELVASPKPGRVEGVDAVVAELSPSLETDVTHILRYEILGKGRTAELYIGSADSMASEKLTLPANPGRHQVEVTPPAGLVAGAVRASGDLTFGYFSCRRADSAAGRRIVATVQSSNNRLDSAFFTPDEGLLFVAPWGDDHAGTGAFLSPFATPGHAISRAAPGDTIILRPGVYAPFAVTATGAPDQPLTIATLPGEERRAVIEGDLTRHVAYGGPGVPQSNDTRDGIYIVGRDHVHIRDLTIRNVWRAGIFIVGTEGETHGQHVLAGNAISRTGSAGIFVGGRSADEIVPLDLIGTIETDGVLIERNDVSQTNVVTDFNGGVQNSQNELGGTTEAISVAALAGNIVTRFNDVHDTRQYGIDYKAGVRGGAIYGNRVWNVARYGIYLDTGRRFVEDIAIHDNQVWNCRMGIVLAREAGSNSIDYDTFRAQQGPAEFVQSLQRIDIYNNVVWNIEKAGLFCQRHAQKDGPDGDIREIRIRFNTIFNANRDAGSRDLNLSGWSDSDFQAAGVTASIDFIGNIVWNATNEVSEINEFTGQPGFTVAGNLIGVDPGFTDQTLDPPNLTLGATSPAIGAVGAETGTAPFDFDIDGNSRAGAPAAGAYAQT